MANDWKILKDYYAAEDKDLRNSLEQKIKARLQSNKEKALRSLEIESKDQRRAREIMGANFIGIPEAEELLEIGDNPSILDEIPFYEQTLLECRETHVLHPVRAINIHDLHQQFQDTPIGKLIIEPEDLARWDCFDGWDRWVLIRKDFLPESDCKTWKEQAKLLGEKEMFSSAQVLFFSIVLRSLVKAKSPIDFNGWCLERSLGSRVSDTVINPSTFPDRGHIVVNVNICVVPGSFEIKFTWEHMQ